MKNLSLRILTVLILTALLVSCQEKEDCWILISPDYAYSVEIAQEETDTGKGLFYSLLLKSNETYTRITDLAPLGLICEGSRFVEDLEFMGAERSNNQVESYKLVTGKKLNHETEFNALSLTFQNADLQTISLVFRAYNKGIAFQYVLPGENGQEVTVLEEITAFDFKGGNFWGHPYDTLSNYTPAYETYYRKEKVGTEAPWNKNGWAFPILVESMNTWMLVSEAGFDGSYGASHLEADCEGGKYLIRFAEAGSAEGYYENTSTASLPFSTPWRFVAMGRSLSEILETSLPTDLSAPSKIDDTSWIKPGRATWSWLFDNDSPQDYDRMLPFVDFAAAMGYEYFLVDANWNRMKNGTMEDLAVYAADKDLGLFLWYNSGGKHNVVTEEPRDLMWDRETRRAEFERISQLGIKGVKVDFFQSDKQRIIRQYLDILKDAADFKILVNFHGCTMPKGWRRTWPNLVSMEAVRGEECYLFDPRFPLMAPPNMCILPFTRNAVGPVDYTPGGFSDNTYPHLSTYGFELATKIVLETGVLHLADTPDRIKGLPSFAVDFLREIPVVWDDTRYLTGYPGNEAVLARRKGTRWYMAGVNGENESKELSVDLAKLGTMPTGITFIGDGDGARDLQNWTIEPGVGKLSIALQAYGGFVAYWDEP